MSNEVDTRSTLEKVVIPKVELSIAKLEPLFFSDEEIAILRNSFEASGLKYDIGEREMQSLLKGPRLRLRVKASESGVIAQIYNRTKPEGQRWEDMDVSKSYHEDLFLDPKSDFFEDKGFGLLASLGTERTTKLVVWTYETAVRNGHKAKIGGISGTEGRGALQQAADLIALTMLKTSESATDLLRAQFKSNTRLEKGLIKTAQNREEEIRSTFDQASIPMPSADTASFPPIMFADIIRFLSN